MTHDLFKHYERTMNNGSSQIEARKPWDLKG